MPSLICFGPHIITQNCFGFGATHVNPIGVGPHIVLRCHPPKYNYKDEILRAKKALEDSYDADLPFPDYLSSYITTQTLNKIRKDRIIADY